MRQLIVTGLLAVSALATPVLAQTAQSGTTVKETNQPGKVSSVAVVKATAHVTAIDTATRKIELKGTDGQMWEVIAGDEVKNFNQINVGDQVKVDYVKGFTAEVKKTAKGEIKAPASSVKEREAVSAKPGEKPSVAEGVKTTILADVVAVDKKKKTITLKGPKGNLRTIDIKNPDHFKVVKKGDQVEIVYVEAMAVAVTTSK